MYDEDNYYEESEEYTCNECGCSITEEEYNDEGLCEDCAETIGNLATALNNVIDYLLDD